jgi:hypothetical protein
LIVHHTDLDDIVGNLCAGSADAKENQEENQKENKRAKRLDCRLPPHEAPPRFFRGP